MPDPNAPAQVVPDLEPGSTVTDRLAIEDKLRELQLAASAQPTVLKYAGDEPASADGAAATVTADELKPPLEPQKAEPPKKLLGFPEPTKEGAPVWAIVPPGMLFPQGRPAWFMRFDAHLTYTPARGIVAPDNGKLYRQCIFWPMSVGDKKIAAQRSMGDQIRFSDEMVKSCIRAIDGELVTGANANLDVWWDQVGEKVRSLLHRLFGQAHYLSPEETTDFLVNCVEARSAG